MGLMAEDGSFAQESFSGSRFTARVAARTLVGDIPAIVVEVAGDSWIIGEHTFVLDEDDPLRFGFEH
jgi:proline racemase